MRPDQGGSAGVGSQMLKPGQCRLKRLPATGVGTGESGRAKETVAPAGSWRVARHQKEVALHCTSLQKSHAPWHLGLLALSGF